MIWLFCGVALAAAGLLAARTREQARTSRLVAVLCNAAGQEPGKDRVRLASLSALPAPVARYFALVLRDGQALIRLADLHQSGELRTQPEASRWLVFNAHHLVRPLSADFVWNARVDLPLGTHVRVIDSYVGGTGSGRVSFLSAVRVGMESGTAELNAGALHRYLAESVWFPTALLPQSGVDWTGIDDSSALATLTDASTTVSLEFRFNESGEVAAIYTPGRWARTRAGYESLPWEGHFGDYREHAGMRIPFYGEVGWYRNARLQLVWKGRIEDASYELDEVREPPAVGG